MNKNENYGTVEQEICLTELQSNFRNYPKYEQPRLHFTRLTGQNSGGGSGSSKGDKEEFWLRVYSELSESSQQRLLVQAAERSSADTLQRARLSLILVKRFPGQATRVGEPLIESLLGRYCQ